MSWFKRKKQNEHPEARSLSAAMLTRQNEELFWGVIKTNEDIKLHLDKARAASREMAKNDPIYRRYLRMCERNIVGENGFRLQMRAATARGKRDDLANDLIEEQYRKFSKVGAPVCSGKWSMRDLDKLIVRLVKMDGEVFLHRIISEHYAYGIAYKLYDPAACPLDLNFRAENGNRVKMGIELDMDDRPVAYYFEAATPDQDTAYNTFDPVIRAETHGRTVRIPAAEINHIYAPEFAGQLRGFPFGQAAIQNLNLLASYYKVELVAADSASRKIGKLINKQLPSTYGGRNQNPETPSRPVVIDNSPGSIDLLTGDWDFKTYDPQHPAGNFPPFVKAQMRNAACALDVSYNTLANDLEGVNYSSIRAGVLDERAGWMDDQRFFIEHLKEPEFAEFLRVQILSGRLALPYDMDRLNRPLFLGRRWAWVDPLKDAQSCAMQLKLGATTPQQIAANLGGDFYDNLADIAAVAPEMAEAAKTIALFDGAPNPANEGADE